LIDVGILEDGRDIFVKGSRYNILDFVIPAYKKTFSGAEFLVFYLSPRDYHRIHFPISGKLEGIYYFRGRLYPVNDWGVKNVNRLFVKNERLLLVLDTDIGKVLMWLVGAFLVGSIKLDFLSDEEYNRLIMDKYINKEYYFSKGDMLGRFCFGSTVILFFERGNFSKKDLEVNKYFYVGERII